MNKLSEVILSILGDLTYWEVSQQTKVQTLLVSLVVDIGQNSALQWGVRGWGGWGESHK